MSANNDLPNINFVDFMTNNKVVIPLIQREYAQGRDNTQGDEVRKNFIPELIEVLTGGKSLELDFIFGVKEDKKFIPLDGQQRLTTLLLLHWYCGAHKGNWYRGAHNWYCEAHKEKWSEAHKEKWSFTYESRRMANSFVNGLLNDDSYTTKEKPSKWIKKQEWFFENWLTDPTVSGMLLMLDEIHEKAKSKNCDKNNLEKITFYLYPIEQLDADNAYTKMNARGEPLTEWENIKALLDKKTQEFGFTDKPASCMHTDCSLSQWVKKIDGDWLFKLEEYAKLKQNELQTDDKLESAIERINCAFRNIFDLAICIDLARQINKERAETKKAKDEKITILQNEISKFHSHEALLSDYQTHVTRQTFEIAVDLFHALCKKKDVFEKGWSCTLCFWNSLAAENKSFTEDFVFNEKYNFADCIRFYAASKFAGEQPSRWLRVIWNIVENGPEINNANFSNVIELVDTLSPHSGSIIDFLAKSNELKVGFALDQLQEEQEKAEKITTDPQWETCIISAEKTAFFKGAIRFLYHNENGEVDWSQFKQKFENSKQYFEKNGVCSGYQVKLIQTLISQSSNWLQQIYDKKIFNPDAKNWKHILCSSNWQLPIHNILMSGTLPLERSENIENENAKNIFKMS